MSPAGDDRVTAQTALPYPTKRLKHIVSLRQSRANGNGGESPYIGLENIEPWTGKLFGSLSTATKDDSVQSNVFSSGDVLFGKLRPYLAKVWVAEFAGRSTTECLVMKPVEVESRFLGYACLSRDFIDAVNASTFGSKMPRAEWGFIGNMHVPVPHRRRQCAVADYLDRETAKLDELVAAKERVLELLADRRQVIIAAAVTGGAKPKVRHCTFGVPWLGEIPAHWKLGRLKDFGSLIAGAGFPHEFQGVLGETLPFYKVGDLSTSKDNRRMGESSNTVSYETAARLRAHVVPSGAIVYAKIGAALLLNRRRITAVPCVIDNNMTAYLPHKEKLTSRWAFYWTSILDFGMLANPGAVPSLSEGVQAQLPIAIPSVTEQRAITDYLDRETARLNTLEVKIQGTITLLKERRASLIAGAVTGQVDVRNAA